MFCSCKAMHSYAVALHEVGGSETTLDLARRLEATHPRDLLARALPGCSTRLYSLPVCSARRRRHHLRPSQRRPHGALG